MLGQAICLPVFSATMRSARMRHDWILDVLRDLHAYAGKNDLPRLAEAAQDALDVARSELAEGAERAGPDLNGPDPNDRDLSDPDPNSPDKDWGVSARRRRPN